MNVAVPVLLFFAAIWGVSGLAFAGAPTVCLLIPPLISLVAWLAVRHRLVANAPHEAPRIRRLIGLWSGVETVLIVAAAIGLGQIGQPLLLAPAIAVIVGLHLLPIARGLPQVSYYWAGFALIALGLVGAALHSPTGVLLTSFGGMAILWATVAWLVVYRGRRPVLAV